MDAHSRQGKYCFRIPLARRILPAGFCLVLRELSSMKSGLMKVALFFNKLNKRGIAS